MDRLTRAAVRRAALLAAILAVGGCGRRGDPRPPGGPALPAPRAHPLVRMGDRVAARFAEPLSDTVIDWIADERFHCREDETPDATLQPVATAWPPWAAAAAPTTGAAWVRLRSADGRRSGPWRALPARDRVPAPPAVTAGVGDDGRVTLYAATPVTLIVERPQGDIWLRDAAAPAPLRYGPFAPGAVARFRVFAADVSGPRVALSAAAIEVTAAVAR